MKYLFTLGRQPHISAAEIQAVLKYQKIEFDALAEHGLEYIIETAKPLNASELIERLGGTVSIEQQVDGTENTSVKNLEQFLADYIENAVPEGKIHFSIQGIGKNSGLGKSSGLNIKKELKARGRSVRYIEPKNTATILHNGLVEKGTNFIVSEAGVFVTRAIQPIEDFSARDYGKPGVDSKSGMLPPKLARMMVNLSGRAGGTLLDPFCGSGVLLMEAALLDFDVIGSDISDKAVEDTQKNLEWISHPGHVFVANATKLAQYITKKVSVIASEPYMGKPLHGNESRYMLERQADELGKLYVATFSEFKKIIEPGGTIIFIIPRFLCGEGCQKKYWVTVGCVSKIEALGFSQVRGPLLYHRPGQHVGREIFSFKKK